MRCALCGGVKREEKILKSRNVHQNNMKCQDFFHLSSQRDESEVGAQNYFVRWPDLSCGHTHTHFYSQSIFLQRSVVRSLRRDATKMVSARENVVRTQQGTNLVAITNY